MADSSDYEKRADIVIKACEEQADKAIDKLNHVYGVAFGWVGGTSVVTGAGVFNSDYAWIVVGIGLAGVTIYSQGSKLVNIYGKYIRNKHMIETNIDSLHIAQKWLSPLDNDKYNILISKVEEWLTFLKSGEFLK